MYYYQPGSPKYEKLNKYIDDDKQIYRFSDYGIQKSKDGISFTLKANMGTWYDRVPIVKDAYGIRTITPEECLALQGYPSNFRFPVIPDKSKYKQAGNTVVVPVVSNIIKRLSQV